jgi:MFS family permease
LEADHTVPERLKNTFSALSVRNYRLFATGQLVSLLGNWMQVTAQDWLVLKLSHNSPSALGIVTALQFTPVLLFTLVGGQLADRFDKRRILLCTNAAYAILAAFMGALVVSGSIELWMVFCFAAAWGTVGSFDNPVRQSFVSEMVGRDLLPNALGLNSAVFNSARIIGPAVGGLTIAFLGTGTAFVVNAFTFIGPFVALLRMVPAELHRDLATKPEAGQTRIAEALRYVRNRRDLAIPMLLILVAGLFAFNFTVTLPVLAKNVFDRGAGEFGLLSTFLAIGALSGALVGGSRRRRPSTWLVTGGAIAFGLIETVLGLSPSFILTLALLIPTGFSMIFFVQAANQRIQMGTDGAIRGRVMALYVLVFMGTTPVGAPIVGWIGEVAGPRTPIWAGGLLTLVAAVIVFALEQRRHGVRVRLHPETRRLTVAPKIDTELQPEPEPALSQA